MNKLSYGEWLLALCVWREARGTSMSAQKGVLHSIMNRAAHPSWWGNSLVTVITHHAKNHAGVDVWQYSSMAPHDPNSCLFPTDDDIMWYQITSMVADSGIDPTAGATNYYSTDIAEPEWAARMTFLTSIGPFKFYR